MIRLTEFRENPFIAGSKLEPYYLFVDPKSGHVQFNGSACFTRNDKQFALRDDGEDVVLEMRFSSLRNPFDIAFVADKAAAAKWVEAANRMLASFAE